MSLHAPDAQAQNNRPLYARSLGDAGHDLLPALAARYDIVRREINVGAAAFSLYAVRDTNRLVDAIDPATFAIDERFPYWAELWPSALELAQWVGADADMRGKAVLEVGCGLGLAGIAAAKAGANVTMTDYEEEALMFAEVNVTANLSPEERARVALRHLDWRTPPSGEQYELVIGSDVVYERRNFAPLLALLRQVLVPGGYALLTEPGRRIGADFFAVAAAEGFTVSLSTADRCTEGGTITVTRALLAVTGGDDT